MSRLAFVLLMALLLLQSVDICAQGTEGGHLYAVLVNGGRNRLTNHERYWNDCAFLYRTLRQTFRIPKRNITVLMSDGGNPKEDMLRADGQGFISSPTDLDGDGESDVNYPATTESFANVLLSMSRRLDEYDHLFLYFIDHGGTYDNSEDSFIWLWNDERLNDYYLASLLKRLKVGSINILMGQCYSGGFVSDLMGEGLIVATACSGREQSSKCPDRSYDEFVYQWTCAVKGADEFGNAVYADTNRDGEVSMLEAFQYAQAHDRVPETPQYVSWPEQLGQQWTFKHAYLGTLGIEEVKNEEMNNEKASAIWSVSGIRQQHAKAHSVYIERRGGKVRKIVR